MRTLLRVDITAPDTDDLAERVEAWLSQRAAQGWEETFEGDAVRFRVHLEDGPPARDFAAAALADWPELAVTTDVIEEEDWGAAWKEFFTPIAVGDMFEILPPWLADTDTQDRTPILIEPKMAFGTGHHPTTALCLEAFAACAKSGRITAGQRFLDLGTGSGILGIGLTKLGLAGCGLDIDPQAIWCAAENLRLNAVGAAMALAVGGIGAVAPQARFDVVAANILAAPLTAMAPRLARHVAPGGVLVLSGILVEQAPGVVAAYRAAADLPEPEIRTQGEWASLLWR